MQTHSLSELVDLEQITALFESYSRATGIPVNLLSAESDTNACTPFDFCAQFHLQHPQFRLLCDKIDAGIRFDLTSGNSSRKTCHCGLQIVTLPILFDGTWKGAIVFGPFVSEDEQLGFDEISKQATERGYDIQEYRAGYETLPVFSEKQIGEITHFYSGLGTHITQLARQTMEGAQYAEQCRKAEQLIALQQNLAITLNREANLDSALKLCLDCCFSVPGITAGGIYLFDEDNWLKLVCNTNLSHKFVTAHKNYAPDSRHSLLVLAGTAVYLNYDQILNLTANNLLAEGLKSVGFIPVAVNGKIVACMNIGSHKCTEIGESERKTLEFISAQVGNAVVRFRD